MHWVTKMSPCSNLCDLLRLCMKEETVEFLSGPLLFSMTFTILMALMAATTCMWNKKEQQYLNCFPMEEVKK